MTPVTDTRRIPSKIWKVILSVTAVVACAALVLAAFAYSDARHGRRRIRDGLIESCVRVARPTEQILARILEDEQAQAATANPKYFPAIPRPVFERLVRQQQLLRAERLREIERFPPCIHRFTDR